MLLYRIILEESNDIRGVFRWSFLVLNDFRWESVARSTCKTPVNSKWRAHFRLFHKVNRLHHLFLVVIWISGCPVLRSILIIGWPLTTLWFRSFNCLKWGRYCYVMNYFSLKQGLQILRVNSVASWSALVQRFVFVLWCLEICNKLPWLFFCWTISLSVMSILFLIFANALRQFFKWSLDLIFLLIYIITFRITAVFHLEYRALVIQLIMLFVVVLASLFALIFIATCFIIFVDFLQSFHFSVLLEIQENVLWSWTLMLLFTGILKFFLTSEYLWLLTLSPLWFD